MAGVERGDALLADELDRDMGIADRERVGHALAQAPHLLGGRPAPGALRAEYVDVDHRGSGASDGRAGAFAAA